MNAPAILLADEPTGNLDSKNSAEIMSLLRASNRQLGQTLVVITHDEGIALTADRVVAIEDGRVASDERRGGRRFASVAAKAAAGHARTPDGPRAGSELDAQLLARGIEA